MCGGGTGSANDSSNDNESGSGNSFKETLANIFTPGDGLKYVDGQLTATNAQSSYKPPVSGNDNSGVTNVQVRGQDGNTFNIPSNQTQMSNTRIASALFGAATGGIPGLIGNLAMNELTKGKATQGLTDVGSGAVKGVKGLFKAREFDTPEEKAEYEKNQRAQMMRQMDSMNNSNSSIYPDVGNAPTVATPTVSVNSGIASPSAMSVAAGEGGFQPVPNPNYDPNDPMSQQFLSNPTYAQLLAYRDSGTVPGMAQGGELTAAPPEGGNEKTMISDAVSAVKGEMSEEQSAVVLGQFLANYGEEALRDLVDKVQSGEFDDTVDRFANGEAGEVRGPGDGSGVDDKVPASLGGQQDVLLADGEFVLRKKTADALEKKYGGGFLDAVNKAESAAPKTMQQYMARN
jgi:hypothetical protein